MNSARSNFSANSSDLLFLEYQLSKSTLTIATVAYTLIFLLGILGNVLVLVVVCCNKDMRSSTNYFLVNLSVADLLVLVFCMPIALLETYVIRPWLLGEAMCKLIPFLEYSAAQASVLTLAFISIERYVAICYPLKAKYTITPKRCIVFCSMIWFISCLGSVPYLFMAKYSAYDVSPSGDLLYECGTFINSLLAEVYIISCFVLFFVIPLFVLGAMYLKVAFTLHRSMSMIRNKVARNHNRGKQVIKEGTETSGVQMDSLVNKGPRDVMARRYNRTTQLRKRDPFEEQERTRSRVVYMLITVVITFFLCLLPQRIVSLWFQYGTAEQQMTLGIEGVYRLVISCRVLTYINSSINPIIYNVMSTKFRSAFLRALGLKKQMKRSGTMTSGTGSMTISSGTVL
ncbi:QRFP-like peptide receptor [Glandiceps talaboti]